MEISPKANTPLTTRRLETPEDYERLIFELERAIPEVQEAIARLEEVVGIPDEDLDLVITI